MDTFTITEAGITRKCLYLRSGWSDALDTGIRKLQVLKQLMYYVRPADDLRLLPRPCDVFDYIIGEGSSGIIALFLGRFQMTIDDCQKHFVNLMLMCFTETSSKPPAYNVKVPVGIDLSKIFKGFVAPGGGRHRPVQRARTKLAENDATLKIASKYSRPTRAQYPGGEFNITGNKTFQPATGYLQATTNPVTAAYLIRWIRMTDALNLLIHVTTSVCATIIFPANDYSRNLLESTDFLPGGCTQGNVDTLRRILDSLCMGGANVAAPAPETWSQTQGHPHMEDVDLLKVFQTGCSEYLSATSAENLASLIQSLPSNPPHEKPHQYEVNGASFKIGRIMVPWTEFGHVQTYEPARDVVFSRNSQRGFPAYKASQGCHDEFVESPAWALSLRSDDILKTMFRNNAALLRDPKAPPEPKIQRPLQPIHINSAGVKGLSSVVISEKPLDEPSPGFVSPGKGLSTVVIKEEPVDERPLRLLSLDGGGVRGLSSLLILQEQMRLLEKTHGKKDPWEVFDMISGTSTGGILAIMLGRLRLSIEECIVEYENLARDIFGQPNGSTALYKYSGDNFARIIKELLKRKRGSEDLFMQDVVSEGSKDCKVFVVCLDIENIDVPEGVRLIRSYTRDGSPDPGAYIWEAARATSAAPTVFPPLTLESSTGLGSSVTLVDGALGHNNPTLHMLREARAQWPGRKIGSVLSIGTGQQKGEETFFESVLASTGGRMQAIALGAKYLMQTSTSSENIHRSVVDWFDIKDYHEGLYRYTVPTAMGMNVKIDEFRKYDEIRTCTEEYLRQPGLQSEMHRYEQAFDSDDGVTFRLPRARSTSPPLLTSLNSFSTVQGVPIHQSRDKVEPSSLPGSLTTPLPASLPASMPASLSASLPASMPMPISRPVSRSTPLPAVAPLSDSPPASRPAPLQASMTMPSLAPPPPPSQDDVGGGSGGGGFRKKFRFAIRGSSAAKAR